MKTINVVAAIIVSADRKIFATQRGYGDYKGWWEFPGGKIEEGESKEEALKREILEELACPISVERFFDSIEYDYPKFHLHMDCFLCSLEGSRLIQSYCLELHSTYSDFPIQTTRQEVRSF